MPPNQLLQLYFVGRDIRGDEYEQVWNQLEAEIHLHRHKTVIRACRQNLVSLFNYYRRTIPYIFVHIRFIPM